MASTSFAVRGSLVLVALAGALVCGVAVAAPPGEAVPLDGAAPKAGTLEHFMKTQVKAAMSSGDIAKVKDALKKLPAWAPEPAWNEGPTGWKAIVDTATKPDGNVGKACKGCHETWQKLYKEKFADRILPK